jgi:hypothetical protein
MCCFRFPLVAFCDYEILTPPSPTLLSSRRDQRFEPFDGHSMFKGKIRGALADEQIGRHAAQR